MPEQQFKNFNRTNANVKQPSFLRGLLDVGSKVDNYLLTHTYLTDYSQYLYDPPTNNIPGTIFYLKQDYSFEN